MARDSLNQSHTNYLTRVQIEIAQSSQKTDAFMNRITVFASIFGPLSVISGIWGMNVKVPGQDVDNVSIGMNMNLTDNSCTGSLGYAHSWWFCRYH